MEQVQTAVETTVETTQVVPSLVPEAVIQSPPPVKDLTTKISEFKKSQIVPTPQDNQNSFFDYKDLEKITDPTARKFAEDAYKSMQAGLTRKTQAIAEKERGFEQKLQEMQNWTPERIQRELSNPQFVQAAQQYQQIQNPPNSGLTEEQFSALTPQEKAELAQVPTLKNEINQLKQVNLQGKVSQRDSQLQAKYPDYNPNQINETINNLAHMDPLDIREHVYKSLKHDEDVSAAYELGRQESKGLTQTKINAITQNGNSATPHNFPIREKGDTDQMWFGKIANFRLAEFKNRK